MMQGFSSQRGIMFGDPSLPGDNAVYCWYGAPRSIAVKSGEESGKEIGEASAEGNAEFSRAEISGCEEFVEGDKGAADCGSKLLTKPHGLQTLVGPYDEVVARFKEDREADKVKPEKDPHIRVMLALLLVAVVLPFAVAALTEGAAPVVGAAVFAVVGWFPAYAIIAAPMHEYASDELFQQFRRHHGAEHAVSMMNRRKKPAWEVTDLRAMPWVERECGNVYMATLLVWALIAGIAIAFFPQLGLLKTAGALVGSLVLLLLNTWFNPWNPLRYAQLRMVAKPTDADLALASTCMQEFLRIKEAAEQAEKALRLDKPAKHAKSVDTSVDAAHDSRLETP